MGTGSPDVHVVGGGIIGMAVAWRLAKAGAHVRVSDAGAMGRAASHAAAGMLAPGGEIERDQPLLHLAQASLKLYAGFVDELREESGLDIDYRECGAVERAANDAGWKQLVCRARRQQELGIECDIQGDEVFFPRDAVVNPRQVIAALHCVCGSRGVQISENDSINTVHALGAPTVIAAGCWSGAIAITTGNRPMELPAVFPVKGHLIGYSLEPGSLPNILRSEHTYILQRADGFTIAGSTMEHAGFDTSVDEKICRDLHDRAARLWPDLRGHHPVERWTGLRPGTVDGQPVIGRLGETNVWLAYGHFRNGILLAPVTAEMIAAEITAAANASSGRG